MSATRVLTLLFLGLTCNVICEEDKNKDNVLDDHKNTTVTIDKNKLHIDCNFQLLNTVKSLNQTRSVDEIFLKNCLLPKESLIRIFYSLNVTESFNSLHYVIEDANRTIEPLQQANYLKNLAIKTLKITTSNKDILVHNPDFLEPLNQLKDLKVTGIKLPKLPKISLNILFLDNSSLKDWGSCEFLKSLNMKRMTVEDLPAEWPLKCANLTSLKLENMSEKTLHYLAKKITVSHLRELSLRHLKLVDVPFHLLAATKDLSALDLSHNNLEDKSIAKLPVLHNLTSLDLSNNKLTGWFLVDLPPKLPAIKNLTLDGNRFVHIFRYFQIKSSITQFSSIERLSMNKMLLDPDCLMSAQFSKLKYLGLASNEPIASLLLQSLPSTNASHLEVDLLGRPIRSIPIPVGDYQDKQSRDPSQLWPTLNQNVSLLVSYIDCDCNNAELTRILHEYPHFLASSKLRCNQENGEEILQKPIEKLDCQKEKIGHCIKRTWQNNSVVDCSNLMYENFDWEEMVRAGVKGVNVSGNYISSLRGIDFRHLEWVDLRHNRIARLENSELAQLFAVRSRRVWLGGNIIICDCDNRALLRMLHSHYTQVPDYDSLICVDHDVPLSSLPVARVCRLGEGFVYGICCAGSIFTVIMMILFRCYGSWLKTFMYARGLCISCLEEKDPDADKTYDAFVSFAHQDEAFVLEQLLPRLELTPEPFRVCVHYRDWVVGEWIPAQIMRSVRSSKRTIIVLSKHLAASWWGVLEFRYAHAQAMAEGRTRLLVLILDDVLQEKLDPELKGYLSTNTFLMHDDPWFWDKLHYAMSHNHIRYC